MISLKASQIDDDPKAAVVAQALRALAQKYIWWKTLGEAVASPQRIIAQVMNIGDFDDVQCLADLVGIDALRDVLKHAEIGQFTERSWAYWHIRLGLSSHDAIPPMPTRKFE